MAKKDKSEKKKKSAKLKDAEREARLEISGDLGTAITQASRSLRTVQTRLLTRSGLYSGQEGVVLLLAAEEGLTPGLLAQRLGVKAPTMTRTIGRMEAQGFVERRGSDADGRQTKVYLTETGRATVDRISSANKALERQATQGLSGKEIKVLMKLLAVVEDNLHAQMPAELPEPIDESEDLAAE
ncbi:MarR family winged helix-turn-helix transcriptional regulator [Allorhizobium taibaishanense]|uniref:MarR family transcriptional regulator n=1 Tax=Allorhizobium taibaishanense TaxID=887144 RepID=A0A1Q9A508_9HYPH|nr:MarR family winged helix-turn-helix transcriptional regulator [Allorhizobium taibaishanense]MBB4006762.1 DNA-binding MarR family transcriptional regulator [Allorhizobium taibaishanense]OLP49659.1 MarR family transcriptional regulator [Allorhizobium taibaishanense]